MVKLNWKIAFTKEKQIKKMRVKILKNKTKKKELWLKDEMEIKKKFNKRDKEKN